MPPDKMGCWYDFTTFLEAVALPVLLGFTIALVFIGIYEVFLSIIH